MITVLLKSVKKYDIRGLIDDRNETTGRKVRDAEKDRIPIIIVGDDEIENNSLSVRKNGGEDLGKMNVEQLVQLIQSNVEKELNENN